MNRPGIVPLLLLALGVAAASASVAEEPQICLPGGCTSDADCVGTQGVLKHYLGSGYEICNCDGVCSYQVEGTCAEVDTSGAEVHVTVDKSDQRRFTEFQPAGTKHTFFCQDCVLPPVGGTCALHTGCDAWYVVPGTARIEAKDDGTAVARAELYAACTGDQSHRMTLVTHLAGKVIAPPAPFPPPSPFLPQVPGQVYEIYPTVTSMVATGVAGTPLEGLEIVFEQDGNFQIAVGGNAKDGDYGGAMWANIVSHTNPTGSDCYVKAPSKPIDYNFDLFHTCQVTATCEPDILEPCPEPCLDDGDCTGSLVSVAAELGLPQDEEFCALGNACTLDACQKCSDIDVSALPSDVALKTAFKWFAFAPSGSSPHAFTCHRCFDLGGAGCPIHSSYGTKCRDWVPVAGTTLFEESDSSPTAVFKGSLTNLCDPSYTMDIYAELSGRIVVPAGGSGAPPGSPKSMKAGPQQFTYYTVFEGTVTGTGKLAGLEFTLVRDGPSFQWGIGANDKDADLGASMWETATTVSQPDVGPCLFNADGKVVDINVDFEETCLVSRVCEPDVLPPCDCDVLYEVECGCDLAWATNEDGEKCVCMRFVDALKPEAPNCTPVRVVTDDACPPPLA